MTKRAADPPTDLFFAGDHTLEGVFEEGGSEGSWGGVVVAHPHPLYGGTMLQPVVHRVAKACREQGLATLRFNFRGVGASGGEYSGSDEYLDVEAALAHLQERLGGRSPAGETTWEARREAGPIVGDKTRLANVEVPPFPSPSPLPLGLAGYSFGSVMTALACAGPVPVDALALIAFPVDWEDRLPKAVETLRTYRAPVLAVCGENDDIAPPGPIEELLSGLGLDFRLEVLPGAGHLFEESRTEVGRLVAEFMAEELGRGGLLR